MTVIEGIKAAQVAARKSKQTIAVNVLTTLIGEAEMIGKNKGNRAPTDDEVRALIKKFISNLDETAALIKDPATKADLASERGVLEVFLPAQMTELDLRDIISRLKTKGYTLPQVMQYLKESHSGAYDGKLASTIAKELL